MANISHSDILFATATMQGRQFFNFAGRGLDSYGSLIDKVRQEASTLSGLVTLTIRNTTQGWAESRDFYLA